MRQEILCIDIGGTRIKAAVLPQMPSLEDVQQMRPLAVRTLGWLNQSLPELLADSNWASLAKYFQRDGSHYDAISIDVPGPVAPDGSFLRPDLVDGDPRVPSKPGQAWRQVSGKPVTVLKDADAWILGIQSYGELVGETLEYPVLCLAFGTGVGVSAASAPGRRHSVEISAFPATSWIRLRAVSGHDLREGWHVHRVLGLPYFDWVGQERRKWSYQTIREEFTKRVIGMLGDCRPWLERETQQPFRTIVVAGGNAEYVSARALSADSGCRVIDVTERHMKCGIKPDLLPLLGCERAARSK